MHARTALKSHSCRNSKDLIGNRSTELELIRDRTWNPHRLPLGCEFAFYLAGSLHAKWRVFQTLVREQGVRMVDRPNKSPITAR